MGNFILNVSVAVADNSFIGAGFMRQYKKKGSFVSPYSYYN